MSCVVCGGITRTGLLSWHVVCPSCHYEYSNFTSSINNEQAHTLINEHDREIALRTLRQANFKTIAECASKLAKPSASKLLDVGSAHGWFLDEARIHFKVLGIEPDIAVGKKAEARGLPVRYGYFPNALYSGEQFDVIVFNDVFEHIPDIEKTIMACHEHLTDDGILVLNLPSSHGFFYRISKLFAYFGTCGPFERMWQKDLPSPHVHYFNDANLASLISRHNFDLLQSFSLPSMRANGLMERLRFIGKVSKPMLYTQYLAILCLIPLLHFFASDIMVSVFRKR